MDGTEEVGLLDQQLLNSSLAWYIGYTISSLDRKAMEELEREGITVYAPCHRIDRVFRGKMATLEFALYPHYVFIGIDDEEKFSKARYSGRVLDILCVDDRPYTVDPSIIRNVLYEERLMIHDETVEADKRHKRKGIGVDIGSEVLITEGALEGKTGRVTFKRGNRAKVMLNGSLTIEIKLKSVQLLEAA